jgi:hypothetical protein
MLQSVEEGRVGNISHQSSVDLQRPTVQFPPGLEHFGSILPHHKSIMIQAATHAMDWFFSHVDSNNIEVQGPLTINGQESAYTASFHLNSPNSKALGKFVHQINSLENRKAEALSRARSAEDRSHIEEVHNRLIERVKGRALDLVANTGQINYAPSPQAKTAPDSRPNEEQPSLPRLEDVWDKQAKSERERRKRKAKGTIKRTLAAAAITFSGLVGVMPAKAESAQPIPASPSISSPQPLIPQTESPRPQLIITEQKPAPEAQSSAEIFGALTETFEQVKENPRAVGGYFFGDTVIFANAKTPTGDFAVYRSILQGDGTFSIFQKLFDLPQYMEPFSVIQRDDGSTSMGAQMTISPGGPEYFTSYDGKTFVDEAIPGLTDGQVSEQQQLGDVTLINGDCGACLDGSLLVRYPDKTMKRVTWPEVYRNTSDSMNALRIGNKVIVYMGAMQGNMAIITIEDIYNPQATAQFKSIGGTASALTVKWGTTDAEKVYVATAGPKVLKTLLPSGEEVLSDEISYSQLGLNNICSVRLIDENKLLIGGLWNNKTVLVLWDLTNKVTTSRVTIAPEVEAAIIYERNMQVGAIKGHTFVMVNIVDYGIIAQEIDPVNGTFIGSPIWIVGGLGMQVQPTPTPPPPKTHIYLPIIANQSK